MAADHSALGNALGYLYQFDRATYNLFQSKIDVIAVGIEDLDDVSIHKNNQNKVFEQDKSTINSGSPLADRSTSLWKTLHIWSEMILLEPEILEKAEFHLVTSGQVSDKSLVKRINDSREEKTADKIIDDIEYMSKTLRTELIPYWKTIEKLNRRALTDMIMKISVFDKVCPEFGGDIEKIQIFRAFDRNAKIALFDQMNGWVKRKIIEAATSNQPSRILREEFDKELKGQVKRINVARLSALVAPYEQQVDTSNYESHGFVKQLDWINLDENTIREAIIDYNHAHETRLSWTDDGVVSETTLSIYQRDLEKTWKIAMKRACRMNLETDELTGLECLDLTLEKDSFIHNEIMPKSITSGNFHALAHFTAKEEPLIGWHPNYKILLKGLLEQ
ncbi:ABC-three component system protein [Marinilactibacillus sp. XAAS-LB27]|uniref:ABC-three component system protein n=1 Tax=Marinilactibacillus sp. XAAS-LB27 TaxID=3114538 RepID=UPI002E183D2F|nr:ABC-three component system protein [Marinilactibacillus sp. XAAS-LB27]